MKPSGRPVALVVGGTGLLGSAICRRLAGDGIATLVGYHRSADAADRLANELTSPGVPVEAFACDVTNPDAAAITAAGAAAGGPVTILVVASGRMDRSLALATPAELTEQLIATNVNGVIATVRACLRPMMRARWGRIVLIGSRAGSVGMVGQSTYAASKAALTAYARSLAGEVGSFGITVNVVAPGALDESMTGQSQYSPADAEAVRALIGLRRLGQPAEVAAAVSFLASADASYVSGACLPVDGAARY